MLSMLWTQLAFWLKAVVSFEASPSAISGNEASPLRWAAFGMMIACTIAVIYSPVQLPEAHSIVMAHYLALSGLVGAYFALGGKS